MLAAVLLVLPAAAECPGPDEILQKIKELDLERGSRAARFEQPAPVELYGKAAKNVGKPLSAKEGDRAFGVLVVELPLPDLWVAINDETHHVGYLPVEHSEIIRGTPRGRDRWLFQYLKRLGVGRWWVSEVRMNGELYEASGGTLWELSWEDRMEEVDVSLPPVREVAEETTAIHWSRGAWLLAPIAEDCTLIEYFTWSEPGGIAGLAQSLAAGKAVRDTLGGVVDMASGHVHEPHDGNPFLRPDGSRIESGEPGRSR